LSLACDRFPVMAKKYPVKLTSINTPRIGMVAVIKRGVSFVAAPKKDK